MESLFVSSKTVYDLMYNSMVMAVKVLNTDVRSKLRELIAGEENATARLNLELSLKNCVDYIENEDHLLCPDTGAPTYYVRIGENVRLEEGFSSLYKVSQKAIRDATAAFKLRPNMVHPVTRKNTGTNVGFYAPHLELRFDPDIDYMEVVAVPISGGSETSGTFYRMMSPMDGTKGIMKFILDCIRTSIYAGKTCPPNIIGIGIGGTADLCMKLAKQAAVLRPIGSRHPDKEISELENRLVALVNASGNGPMGMGGNSGVLDVHIEYAATHIAGLPVAYNAQCWLCRRKAARVNADGSITYSDTPRWEYR
jgi:tartrate/fumarate subfamily iron-sulfur-dependent hydro-lyase alpha chain